MVVTQSDGGEGDCEGQRVRGTHGFAFHRSPSLWPLFRSPSTRPPLCMPKPDLGPASLLPKQLRCERATLSLWHLASVPSDFCALPRDEAVGEGQVLASGQPMVGGDRTRCIVHHDAQVQGSLVSGSFLRRLAPYTNTPRTSAAKLCLRTKCHLDP
jgi:hypothetical protein